MAVGLNVKPGATDFVGTWLRSRSHSEFGWGFCSAVRDGKLVVRYVDVPDVAEQEVLVDKRDAVPGHIPVGTRVWVRGKPHGWHPGVVERPITARRYVINLVDHPNQFQMYQDQFTIRRAQPLQNPALAIEHGLTESPTFYEARSALVAEFVDQRRASRGMTAAISAPITLFQHQLDTAVRVLEDPVMRYLLADEVGLGKTIEAGIVIRQLLIDDPKARVLVACPESLHGQWTSELRHRLGLESAIDGHRVEVRAYPAGDVQASLSTAPLSDYDLVVIDEAHNLLQRIPPGSALEDELRNVDALLALSATPLRGDLETFRRLLALVDPIAFADTDADRFLRRLNERERSAGDIQVLTSRRASTRQKSVVVERLLAEYNDDERVQAMVADCLATDDALAESWNQLADYVREIYRLSRRMIRHRRTDDLTLTYSVTGRRPTFVDIDDPARPVIDEFLESYRRQLSESGAIKRFARCVLFALAGPLALRDYLSRPESEDERVLFDMTRARLDMAGDRVRIDRAALVVLDRVNQGDKVVVVSTFASVLTSLETSLHALEHARLVYRHYQAMSSEDRDEEVSEFLDEVNGAVLLADRSMEEGRNLQLATVLVNLDLPLDVNRLDQRIGRLDRYAERPTPAEVVVFTETDSEWVSEQIDLLHRGVRVFDSSVSTVQRLLSTLLDEIVQSLLEKGALALHRDAVDLREHLDAERDNIDLLEEIESIDRPTAFPDEAFGELVDYEADSVNLQRAVHRLTHGVGSLDLGPQAHWEGAFQFTDAQASGLNQEEAAELERLFLPKAFDRAVAIDRAGVSPFRIGDPLADWLQDYLVADERGRATAIVRPIPGISTPMLWLRCEFLVEFARSSRSQGEEFEDRSLQRRGESHLQPLRVETWTDSSGLAPADLHDKYLDLPFDADRDEVLRGPIWAPVLKELPSWSQLCQDSAAAAMEEASLSPIVSNAIERALGSAREDVNRRLAILQARVLRLPTPEERLAAENELDLERRVAMEIEDGIRHPSIRMVTCGGCVLWPEDDF